MKRRRLWSGLKSLFDLVSQLSHLFKCSQWFAITVIYGTNRYIDLALGVSSIISSNCAGVLLSPPHTGAFNTFFVSPLSKLNIQNIYASAM